MRKIILFLLLLIVLLGCASANLPSKKSMRGKEISSERVRFILWKDSCRNIVPNLRLCQVAAEIKSQGSWLLVLDDTGEIRILVYFNSENNNLYVKDTEKEERQISYYGKAYRSHAKSKYYYIGKAKMEKGLLKPSFLEGTRLSYQKRMRNFLNPFDYDFLYTVYINLPGTLKPDLVTYYVYIDGKLTEMLFRFTPHVDRDTSLE